jgi:hypothetical protein
MQSMIRQLVFGESRVPLCGILDGSLPSGAFRPGELIVQVAIVLGANGRICRLTCTGGRESQKMILCGTRVADAPLRK